MRQSVGRAQVESVGTVLLLGLVILCVSGFGVFYLAGFEDATDAPSGSVNVVGDPANEALELTHSGGRSVPLSDLRVAVSDGSGTTECGLGSTCEMGATRLGGDGDDSFDAGETWRLNWTPTAGEELEVTLVDDGENRVLYRESFLPAAESDPARTETATPGGGGSAPSAVARGGSVEGRAGESLTLDGSDATDADGDSLTYDWRVVDRDGLAENATRVVDDTVTTPNASFEVRENVTDGNYAVTVELVVSDESAAASDAATVAVEKVNRAPVADAGPDATFGDGGDDGGTDDHDRGSGRGDDGRWSPDGATARPAELGIGSVSGGAAPIGAVGAVGAVESVGSDGDAAGERARWFGGGRGDGGDGPIGSVTLDGSNSTDADGDELSYEWEVVDGGGLGDRLALSDANAPRPVFVLSGVAPDRDRTVTVRLTVTDDDGATDTDTVTVGVPADDGSNYRHGDGWWAWLLRLLDLLFG